MEVEFLRCLRFINFAQPIFATAQRSVSSSHPAKNLAVLAGCLAYSKVFSWLIAPVDSLLVDWLPSCLRDGNMRESGVFEPKGYFSQA